MLVYKNLNNVVLFVSFFTFFTLYEAWGVFPTAVQLDDHEVMRCLAACRLVRANSDSEREKLHRYWKGTMWKKGTEEQDENPTITRLICNSEGIKFFLGRGQCKGAVIGKGRDLTVVFKGPPLGTTGVWSERDRETERLDPAEKDDLGFSAAAQGWESLGKTHKISFEIWEAFSSIIKHVMDGYVEQYNRQHKRQLGLSDFHITVTGYDSGGRMAQCAAFGMVETLFNGDNSKNNVGVVTFGAPACYDAAGARSWNTIVGTNNHRRFVTEKDEFFKLFSEGGFTGVLEILPQEEMGTLGRIWVTTKEVGRALFNSSNYNALHLRNFFVRGNSDIARYVKNDGAYHALVAYGRAARKKFDTWMDKDLDELWDRFDDSPEEGSPQPLGYEGHS